MGCRDGALLLLPRTPPPCPHCPNGASQPSGTPMAQAPSSGLCKHTRCMYISAGNIWCYQLCQVGNICSPFGSPRPASEQTLPLILSTLSSVESPLWNPANSRGDSFPISSYKLLPHPHFNYFYMVCLLMCLILSLPGGRRMFLF